MRLAVVLAVVAGLAGCLPLDQDPAVPVYEDPVASVYEVQAALSNLGFEPGPIDGKAGSRTSRAVRAYRVSRGLPPKGGIDTALSTSLRVEANAAPGIPAPHPRLVERRWLPGDMRDALEREWPDYLAMLVDLDRDSDLDLIAHAHQDTGLCTGDLCPWVIMERTPGGWRKTAAFEARGIRLRRSRHNGWRDLSVLAPEGAVILRYDGGFYR